MKRSLGLVLLLAALGGCDLLGDDYDDLAPGTFRFRADGKVYTGTARFYPETGGYTNEPVVHLMSTDSIPFNIYSHDLLNPTVGSRIDGYAQFPAYGYTFHNTSGSFIITDTTGGRRAGTFRYKMVGLAFGALRSTRITVEGGFNAVRVAD